MPGAIPASRITSSASPTRSRASSVEKLSETIGATGRCALGKGDASGSARQAATVISKRATVALIDILNFHFLAGHALRQSRGHEAVEIAVQHVRRRSRGDAGPQ